MAYILTGCHNNKYIYVVGLKRIHLLPIRNYVAETWLSPVILTKKKSLSKKSLLQKSC